MFVACCSSCVVCCLLCCLRVCCLLFGVLCASCFVFGRVVLCLSFDVIRSLWIVCCVLCVDCCLRFVSLFVDLCLVFIV